MPCGSGSSRILIPVGFHLTPPSLKSASLNLLALFIITSSHHFHATHPHLKHSLIQDRNVYLSAILHVAYTHIPIFYHGSRPFHLSFRTSTIRIHWHRLHLDCQFSDARSSIFQGHSSPHDSTQSSLSCRSARGVALIPEGSFELRCVSCQLSPDRTGYAVEGQEGVGRDALVW